MALSWVPLQPTCLATGTGFKWLRVYDLRAKNASPMSVVAHNKAVLGVVFDPHQPERLATYSDGPQEPIKVWDIRHLDSSSGPMVSIYPTSKNLAQIAWCPSKAGILVTASTEEKWISLWNVTKHDHGPFTVKKPFQRRYTSEPVTSFSWQQVEFDAQRLPKATTSASRVHPLTAAAFPNRMLTASITGEVGNISVHDVMPLSISSHNAVTFGCGKLLFGGVLHGTGSGTCATTRLALAETHVADTRLDHDISTEMYRLAKQGYALNVSTNVQLFKQVTPRTRPRRNLWLWVDQVETLCRLRTARREHPPSTSPGRGTTPGPTTTWLRGWPLASNPLVGAGIKNLLLATNANAMATPQEDARDDESGLAIVSIMKTDAILGCPYYEGLGRRVSLLACKWDPESSQRTVGSVANAMHEPSKRPSTTPHFDDPNGDRASQNPTDLSTLLHQCDVDGEYARGAALAVFHGDLAAAVALLQQGATRGTQLHHLHVGHATVYTSDLLQLVAMAVAGYAASITTATGYSLWYTTTQHLLQRSEIRAQTTPRYFHALLSFLCVTSAASQVSTNLRATPSTARRRRPNGDGFALPNARPGAYSAILNDITLPLRDRLAFACRYLPADELSAFLAHHEDESEQYGRLEGVLVTGLNPDGVRILQSYLNRTGDVQTLALLAARLPPSYVAHAPHYTHWIQIYQDLLNQWQLFQERARFDVGRAHLDTLRQASHGTHEVAHVPAPVPPQLFVRCNFCNASLSLAGLLRLGGSHASWLNRAKPTLTCCPTCRKPLPQCALCLLPFGSLNPYFELAHRRSRQTAEAVHAVLSTSGTLATEVGSHLQDAKVGKKEYENLAQLSSLPFIEWFTWCQSCKHGGHAHHLATWFATHTECPVTECKCRCHHLDLPLVGDEPTQQLRVAQSPKQDESGHQGQWTRHHAASQMPGTAARPALTSATMGPGATPRTQSSAQLRPRNLSSGYPPPFSLSSSNSMANLTSGNSGKTSGKTSGSATLSDGFSLGTKLDQLEKDTTKYPYM